MPRSGSMSDMEFSKSVNTSIPTSPLSGPMSDTEFSARFRDVRLVRPAGGVMSEIAFSKRSSSVRPVACSSPSMLTMLVLVAAKLVNDAISATVMACPSSLPSAPSSAARRLSSGMYTSVVVDTGAEIRVGVAVLAPSLSCASADEIESGRRSVATTSAASARNA